jgi:hypothetical protein
MFLKRRSQKKKKECNSTHLANNLIFKENKFQLNYQKILECRDINEKQNN